MTRLVSAVTQSQYSFFGDNLHIRIKHVVNAINWDLLTP
jgi:hypothetical protein